MKVVSLLIPNRQIFDSNSFAIAFDNSQHRIIYYTIVSKDNRGTMKIPSQKRIIRFAGRNSASYGAWYVLDSEITNA